MFSNNWGVHAPVPAAPLQREDLMIVYVGPAHKFSDCYVRVIVAEIEGARVARCESLDALQDLVAQTLTSVRLVVVDEGLVPALMEIDGQDREALAGCGVVAIAFREVETVRPLVPALLAWGVRGFVPMQVSLDVLLPIVGLLANGGSHLPTTLFQEIEPPRRPAAKNGYDPLTPREGEILQLLAHGLQNKNIAVELGLSQHTVKLHIHNIIRKLNVTNRTKAAAWYFERHRPESPA